jgi:hypothetical protein
MGIDSTADDLFSCCEPVIRTTLLASLALAALRAFTINGKEYVLTEL